MSPATRVLVVCTGNICRSPLAEAALRAELAGLRVQVESAGTHALVEHPMTEPAQQIARANGADEQTITAHRARQLIEPMVQQSDLVLTMTRRQRSQVVQLVPSALRRAFTVRELARLAETLDDAELAETAAASGASAAARLRTIARALTEQRAVAHGAPQDDDVIDPYRQPFRVYEESAAQLLPALAQVSRLIRVAAQ